jgi:hypothetical protein
MLTPMHLPRAWPTIGLATLLALDLVLVVWAVWPTAPASASSLVTTAAVPSTVPSTPSPAADRSPAPTTDAVATPRPLTRLVVPVGKNVVWAADTGTCTAPGTVHVSDDRGGTWTTHRTDGSVTRIRPDGATAAFVVGATARCVTRMWTTSDAGGTWNGPRSAASAWGRSSRDPRLVHRPGGKAVTPCPGRSPVLDLVGVDRSNATALCGDGTLRRTADAGATWRAGPTREGGVALALSTAGTGVVAWLDADCDGVVVGVLAAGGLGRGRCVDGVDPAPGEVAVGVAPSGVWLTAGDAVLRADGPGAAFERVSAWPTG